MKKILSLVLLLFIAISPVSVRAANEFSTSYVLNYAVNEAGGTLVTEDIVLKNLTDKFFPSSFSLILPGTGISEVEASDSQGALNAESGKEGPNTKLTVKFTDRQIIGLGKEYQFKLKFKDGSISKKLGQVLTVNIPKITQQTQIDNLKLTLSIPVSAGDPDFINHKPKAISESGGFINFTFGKDELTSDGISAIFGDKLTFKFHTQYNPKNNSIFPKYVKLALPRNTNYQNSYIEQIEPAPENTQTDESGNSLAIFKLNPGQNLEVKVTGFIITRLNPNEKQVENQDSLKKFTQDSKFFDKNNPLIKSKLLEIMEGKQPTDELSKVKLIDQFVSNFLRFDRQRLENNDFTRLGSVTALNNPEKALSGEFADLEIALLRASGIPSRQIVGSSLKDPDSKPFSFTNNSLHTWVEFYDPSLGWLTLDPTWENTTSGADYFNYNDLSHLVLLLPETQKDYVLPEKFESEIFDSKIEEKVGAKVDIQINKEILSGFPAHAAVKITNLGNMSFPKNTLQIDTSKILLNSGDSESSITKLINTPAIPPFGNLEYKFNLKTGAIWHSYQDVFQVRFAGLSEARLISVVPILSYKIFAVEIFGAMTMIGLFYFLILIVHHKKAKKT